jgi:hypothetical protein
LENVESEKNNLNSLVNNKLTIIDDLNIQISIFHEENDDLRQKQVMSNDNINNIRN